MKPAPALAGAAATALLVASLVGVAVVSGDDGGADGGDLGAATTTSAVEASTTTATDLPSTTSSTTTAASTTTVAVTPVDSTTTSTTAPGATTTSTTAAGPTNRRILAVETVNGVDQIVRLAPDGSGRAPLTSSATPKGDPSWTTDGRYFVFTDGGDVLFLDAEGKEQPQPIARSGANLAFADPAITADLQRLVVEQVSECTQPCTPVTQVVLFRLGTSDSSPIGKQGGKDPALSPDGSQVAMVEDGALVRYTVTAPDPATTRQVLADGPGISSPAWSPDGSRIVFARTASGTTRLSTVGSNGQAAAEVSSTIAGGQPVFGRAGRSILFVQGDDPAGKASLAIMQQDGSGLSPVTGAPRGAPSW